MWEARRVGRTKALSQCESDHQGGKTGGMKKWAYPKAGPRRRVSIYAVSFRAFVAGFDSALFSGLAFCFAANSCFTLRAMASVSTL